MRTKPQQQIIPFSREAIQWHLQSNVIGLTDYTIQNILNRCDQLNDGTITLDQDIMTGCTMAEMLDDLKIEYND